MNVATGYIQPLSNYSSEDLITLVVLWNNCWHLSHQSTI